MNVIVKPRGSGKTTALVEYMLEPGNEDVVFVAPSQAQANVGFHRYKELGGNPHHEHRFQSASWLEFRDKRERRPWIVIDEADGVLGYFLKAQIEAMTFSERRELP